MRRIFDNQAVFFENQASGVAKAEVEEIPFGTIAPSASSQVQNVFLQFPTTIDEDANNDGVYEIRFWVENWHQQVDVDLNYKLLANASPQLDDTEFTGGTLTPKVEQENENVDKSTYFDATSKEIGIIALQITCDTDVVAYNTEDQDRSDPLLVVRWEKQDGGTLDADEPSPNSDHLWTFSQVDLYIDLVRSVGGSDVTQRWLLGWIADPDFMASLQKETVEFTKGKPSAVAVKFLGSINASIGGQIASNDPWVLQEGLHIIATTSNRKLKYTEKNEQRSIGIRSYSLDWTTNSGNTVQFKVPRGQLFITGEMTPGADEIQRVPFEITPLVNPGTKKVYTLEVSKSPTQTAAIPLTYAVTA